MKQLSTILLLLALALLPLAAWTEQAAYKTWHNRLVIPDLVIEPDRHTPIITEGTFLPAVIDSNYELTAGQNPIILARTAIVKPGGSLIIKEGTLIYAREFARLVVEGKLEVEGTKTQPVIFITNEQHPLNKTWDGIVAAEQSRVIIKQTIIEDASTAISCLGSSKTDIKSVTIKRGSIGVFQTSADCRISQSVINGPHEGIVAVSTAPQLADTNIISVRRKIILIKNK